MSQLKKDITDLKTRYAKKLKQIQANNLQDIRNVMDEFEFDHDNNARHVKIVQLSVKSDQKHMTL